MDLIEDLKGRGLVEHTSADIEKILGKRRTVYLGIDPSADSPQIGNLAIIMLMRRLGAAGHKLVFLVGGGTGMIGDPREKGERSLLDQKTLKANTAGIKSELRKVLGGTSFTLVDNADWLTKIDLFSFLRDIGKHFTVNDLIKRETIKKRLETPDESISFTEFTYALLQGYDYMVLNKKYGVDLQVGGSDQWTNILSGVDLTRKKEGKEVFAFTMPLITDASGKKFGKSEGNAVWTDAKKTSPYTFYQFWLNTADDQVERLLKVYTFLSLAEIGAIMELHTRNPGKREAQKLLAKEVTILVHGEKASQNAITVSEVLFGGRQVSTLSKDERKLLIGEIPSHTITSASLKDGYQIAEALVASGLASSKSDARRVLEANGVSLNGEQVVTVDGLLTQAHFFDGTALLRRGKQMAVLTIEK
ncbi:MAG TPA: tyrosine--tRNA ligase [Candidatus Paceibacterota bacterium]|nr:tyrosine--tRNA ligase [Candidatus Paceibacterota bacterium]